MKCLQCGTELDRLSKWRGSSDYCSEECKKASQEEFNLLAMNRLMQPRPARTNTRAVAGSVRTAESGSGKRTMVTPPAAPSAPALAAPPEASFINDVPPALAELQLRHQPFVVPRPVPLSIPPVDLPMGDALLALDAMLRGMRPAKRPARKLRALPAAVVAHPKRGELEPAIPTCQPEWPSSLGLHFHVVGLENVPVARVAAGTSGTSAVAAPDTTTGDSTGQEIRPVAHRAIPARRPARALPPLPAAQTGSDYFIQVPIPSAPRLRIHLPKPVLNPLRPRYAFAPRENAPERTPEQPVAVEPVVAEAAAPQPEAADAPKVVPTPDTVKQEPPKPAKADSTRKAEPKPAARPVAAVESKPEPSAQPKPVVEASRPGAKNEAGNTDRKAEGKSRTKAEPAKAAKSAPEPAIAAVPAEPVRSEPEPARPAAVRSVIPAESAPAASYAAPSFGGKSESEPEGFFSRMPGWQKVAAALVVVGIAVGAWAVPALSRGPVRPAVLPASAATSMGADSWQTDATTDTTGIARRRVISLYKPGRTKRDYIFEFSGQIEQRAMGWVFRMKDARNYYCLKLEQSGEGMAATTQLVKFAVVNGEEQPHRLIALRQPLPAGAPVRIRLDVRGQNFATQVNGQPVDVWIDNQLAEGTVGFSNESGERAVIRTVKVSY